jgi:hypothetical protein
LSWIPLNGRCEWFDDGKDTKGCEPNAQDLQRKADQLEANIKKSTGLSAQERAALEFELVKTLAWRMDLLNPGGTGPSARASIGAIVESQAYRNLSPERKLALWQVVSTGLQKGEIGRADLGRVAGGMWGLSQNKSVLAAYPELQSPPPSRGAGFSSANAFAPLGLGLTTIAGTTTLQVTNTALAIANVYTVAALAIVALAYVSFEAGKELARGIQGIYRSIKFDPDAYSRGGRPFLPQDPYSKESNDRRSAEWEKLYGQEPNTSDEDLAPSNSPSEAGKSSKTTRPSGKESADDVPSWAQGERMLPGETPREAADRVMRQRFPDGNYDQGPRSDYNRIKKRFERTKR